MIETIIGIIGVVLVVGVGSVILIAQAARNLLYICEPNEVLVFSGRRRVTPEGERGYRIVKGGRAWRVPLVERVDRLDLTNMIIEVAVNGAYSKGGIPLNVQGVANLKIAGHEPRLGAAVERLLGKAREEVSQIAKDLLEGNLRGVLSQLTPEEVNEDKIAFAEKLLEEAEHDLGKLGLVLDTLKVQNVHDDRGYLDSIGRKSSAEIIKKSRIAEAKAKAAAIVRDSENRQRARLQQVESEGEIAAAQAERRVRDAITRATAMMAEETGKVNAEVARAEAALGAEAARVQQVRLQLEADVIQPAIADMEANIAAARGAAAPILENGRNSAQVLGEMIRVWQAAGPSARDVFLFQKLQPILDEMVGTLDNLHVEQLTHLPAGDAGGARGVVRVVEEVKAAFGLDLPRAVESATGLKST